MREPWLKCLSVPPPKKSFSNWTLTSGPSSAEREGFTEPHTKARAIRKSLTDMKWCIITAMKFFFRSRISRLPLGMVFDPHCK